MKKTLSAFISLILLICTFCSLAFPALAANTVAGNKSVDGVAYRLSDDGEYYTVVGYSEDFPKLTIVGEIDGIPVTSIAESAFQNCASLTEIVIPGSVSTVGKAAFRFCENLISVTLPSRLTYIPEECFYDCKLLKKIVLPETLIGIGDRAFYNCTMLSKLTVPASVTDIGHEVFHGCESIVLDVSKNEIAASYASENNVNTDFKNTTAYFMIFAVGGIVIAVIIFAILVAIFKKHVASHPSHDPTIYIDRFFIALGKPFRYLYGKLAVAVRFLLNLLSKGIDALGRISRQRKLKKAEKKQQQADSHKSENE